MDKKNLRVLYLILGVAFLVFGVAWSFSWFWVCWLWPFGSCNLGDMIVPIALIALGSYLIDKYNS